MELSDLRSGERNELLDLDVLNLVLTFGTCDA